LLGILIQDFMMYNCAIRIVEYTYGLPILNTSSYKDNAPTKYKTPIRNDPHLVAGDSCLFCYVAMNRIW